MAYIKTIICLANSRKGGEYCIAGKELVNGEYGHWIRPVSSRKIGEISKEEQRFSNGGCPQLLDIIFIPLQKPQPHKHQTENHLIDSSVLWKKIDEETWDKLEKIKDKPSKLWINNPSYEKNDRIPIKETEGLKNSLFLIYVQSMEVLVVNGSKARAKFTYNEDTYNLRITDPKAESYFFKRAGKKYLLNNVYLCVSLGEPFEGYCYKLIAGIIGKDMPY